MKQSLILVFVLITSVCGMSAAASSQVLQDEIDAGNYSLGYMFGKGLRQYDIEFRPESIWHGLFTPLDNIEPQLDYHEMDEILAQLDSQQLPQPETELLQNELLERQNYSLGYRLGNDLLLLKLSVRPQALWTGIVDAYGNLEPQVSSAEMDIILTELRERANRQAKERKQPIRLEGQQFLAENEQKEGVNTLKSGLQYRVLKSGIGKTPKASDAVLVHYRSRTIEGEEFDNSYPLDIPTPKEFQVNKVLQGWTEALLKMKEGDKWELYIPFYLAYRDSGPMAGQTIIVELELLEILPVYR